MTATLNYYLVHTVPEAEYTHSLEEQRAMEEYIQEALQQGYVVPSTFPASVVFFFVEKKCEGLCCCIDYLGLNFL